MRRATASAPQNARATASNRSSHRITRRRPTADSKRTPGMRRATASAPQNARATASNRSSHRITRRRPTADSKRTPGMRRATASAPQNARATASNRSSHRITRRRPTADSKRTLGMRQATASAPQNVRQCQGLHKCARQRAGLTLAGAPNVGLLRAEKAVDNMCSPLYALPRTPRKRFTTLPVNRFF